MKKIKVQLISYPQKSVIINAVRQPYSNEQTTIETVKKVIKVMKHSSVAEHVFLNFDISGISRLCLQELVRHRHASLTVQSTRFTLNKMLENGVDRRNVEKYFVIPSYVAEQWNCPEDYNDYITCLKSSWLDACERMRLFKKTMNLTNDFNKYFIPEALRVNLAWSINIRSLQNFLSLRLNKSAHFEIRHLASLILNELKDTYIYELLELENE